MLELPKLFATGSLLVCLLEFYRSTTTDFVPHPSLSLSVLPTMVSSPFCTSSPPPTIPPRSHPPSSSIGLLPRFLLRLVVPVLIASLLSQSATATVYKCAWNAECDLPRFANCPPGASLSTDRRARRCYYYATRIDAASASSFAPKISL